MHSAQALAGGFARDVCAIAGVMMVVAAISQAQANAIERKRRPRPDVHIGFISTTEVQQRSLAVPPPQQRDQPRQLRLDTRVGAGHCLCPSGEA